MTTLSDEGRHRVVIDGSVTVGADAFADGHDAIACGPPRHAAGAGSRRPARSEPAERPDDPVRREA